jgi:hypothetical protein
MLVGNNQQSNNKWNVGFKGGDGDTIRTTKAHALINLRATRGGLNVLEYQSLHNHRNSMSTT